MRKLFIVGLFFLGASSVSYAQSPFRGSTITATQMVTSPVVRTSTIASQAGDVAIQISTSITMFLPFNISGRTDGSPVAPGLIGYSSSTRTSGVSYGSSGVISDMASITVPAGNYLVSGCHTLTQGSDTAISVNTIMISTTTGNTAGGNSIGKDRLVWDISYVAGGFRSHSWCIAPIYYSFSSQKTYFFKAAASYTNTTPSGATYIQAVQQP